MDGKRITGLIVQKNNLHRVSIFLDDEFAFGLDKTSCSSLSVGQVLTSSEIEILLKKDHDHSAYEKALQFLGTRPHSTAEIYKKLHDSGFEESVINQVIIKLSGEHLIDDAGFSAQWIEDRKTFHPRSRRVLAYELRQKGISDETIQASLRDVNDEETALELALRYRKRYRDTDGRSFRLRLSRYLAQKGYDYDVVNRVSQQVLEEETSGEENSYDDET